MEKINLSTTNNHENILSQENDTKKNIKSSKKKYARFKYTLDALKEAVAKVRSNLLSANKASKYYKIPKGTLIKKLHENTIEPTLQRMGPPTILTTEEEERIKIWLLNKARIGCAMHHKVVKYAIKHVLDQAPRPNCFKNNMPGERWFKLFLKRHPEISMKNAEVLLKRRGLATEENVRQWFTGLEIFLISINAFDILEDPSRICNMDEMSVLLCPKTGKLLRKASEKNIILLREEKESITVLCSYSADGKVIRPMIVYPYKRFPPKDSGTSVPDGYDIGHSPSGCMTTETFNTYIKNGFYKQLKDDNVQFPVLLLLDSHFFHISLEIHDFCKANGIILYCIFHNAAQILQPCDVDIFRPLKKHWQMKVAEHSQVSTENFAPLFKVAFDEAFDPVILKKSFEYCGLFPFNPDKIDYTKCISDRQKIITQQFQEQMINNNKNTNINSFKENLFEEVFLQNIETNIPRDILNQFELAYKNNELPPNEIILFRLWKQFKDAKLNNIYKNCEENDVQSQYFNQKGLFSHIQDVVLTHDRTNTNDLHSQSLGQKNFSLHVQDVLSTDGTVVQFQNFFGENEKLNNDSYPTIKQEEVESETMIREVVIKQEVDFC